LALAVNAKLNLSNEGVSPVTEAFVPGEA